MWLQSTIAHTIRNHQGAQVVLHGIHHAGTHTTTGGATRDDGGVHGALQEPARQSGFKKSRGRLLANHPLTRLRRERSHNLRGVRLLGEFLQRRHTQRKDVDIRAIARVAGLFHDLGKATPWFQKYLLHGGTRSPLSNHAELGALLVWWYSAELDWPLWQE